MSFLGTPSLASATSTDVESACKHIQQCRVSQDHLTILAGSNGEELKRNKFRYCVHKNELVLCIGKPWDPCQKKFQTNAYPRVLSSLGMLGDKETNVTFQEARKMIIYMYHNATSIPHRNALLNAFKDATTASFVTAASKHPYFHFDSVAGTYPRFKEALKLIHDFSATGYANTVGWAHAGTGDTMSSVMIGGLRTVMNGDFEVYCGDLIQWYWPFERDCFQKDGARLKVSCGTVAPFDNVDPAVDGSAKPGSREVVSRKRFYDQEFGQPENHAKTVAYIKPYKRDDNKPRIYDWYRVFAVAISSARPHEKVDIRISRQSL